MKHLLVISALLVCALALVLAVALPRSPHTASAAPPIKFTSNTADADAHFFSDVNGVFTDTSVFVGDASGSGLEGAFERSSVQLDILRNDINSPEPSRDLFGQAELAPDQFQMSADLTSATLNAVVTVCDRFTGTECLEVTVDLTWVGSGDLNSFSEKRHLRTGSGCRENVTFSSSFRGTTATGTASDGSLEFIFGPSISAGMNTTSAKGTTFGDCSPPEPTPSPSSP